MPVRPQRDADPAMRPRRSTTAAAAASKPVRHRAAALGLQRPDRVGPDFGQQSFAQFCRRFLGRAGRDHGHRLADGPHLVVEGIRGECAWRCASASLDIGALRPRTPRAARTAWPARSGRESNGSVIASPDSHADPAARRASATSRWPGWPTAAPRPGRRSGRRNRPSRCTRAAGRSGCRGSRRTWRRSSRTITDSLTWSTSRSTLMRRRTRLAAACGLLGAHPVHGATVRQASSARPAPNPTPGRSVSALRHTCR